MKTGIFPVLAVLWMALIYFLSSLPGKSLGPDELYLDLIKKGGHVALFGILSILYLYALKRKRSLGDTGIGVFMVSFIFTVLYAASDEYHQLFTPGRHGSVIDVFIDSCGAIIFLSFAYSAKSNQL